MYNPSLGRFNTIDPYSQFNSPYLAMANNPISYIDPDGGRAVLTQAQQEKILRHLYFNKRNMTRRDYLAITLSTLGVSSYQGMNLEGIDAQMSGQYGWYGMNIYLQGLGNGFIDAPGGEQNGCSPGIDNSDWADRTGSEAQGDFVGVVAPLFNELGLSWEEGQAYLNKTIDDATYGYKNIEHILQGGLTKDGEKGFYVSEFELNGKATWNYWGQVVSGPEALRVERWVGIGEAPHAAGQRKWEKYVRAQEKEKMEKFKNNLDHGRPQSGSIESVPFFFEVFSLGSGTILKQGSKQLLKQAAKKEAENVVSKAIEKGSYTVYKGVRNGKTVYWGLTKDFAKRQTQHGDRFDDILPVFENLNKSAARGLEQIKIDEYGLLHLENIINGISKNNPNLSQYYRDAIRYLQQ